METYVTTYGRELEVVPISLILMQKMNIALRKQYEDRGVVLEPPQYCTELPGGAQQCYPHDKDTIIEESTSQEDKDTWDSYESGLAEFNSELGDHVLGAIVMDQPIEYEDGWEKKLEWLGLEIPEDELDRKLLYVSTRVLRSPDDIQGYMMRVMEISAGSAGSDAVEAARAMFRSNA